MNIKRYVGAALALFAFIFFYEWFVHGFILMSKYKETPQVWRSFDEMAANMPISMLFQLVFAAWVAFMFTQFYPVGGVSNGLLFGLYVGILVGILTATWYLWLPVSSILGLSWFFSGIIEGVIGGYLLGIIYSKD